MAQKFQTVERTKWYSRELNSTQHPLRSLTSIMTIPNMITVIYMIIPMAPSRICKDHPYKIQVYLTLYQVAGDHIFVILKVTMVITNKQIKFNIGVPSLQRLSSSNQMIEHEDRTGRTKGLTETILFEI